MMNFRIDCATPAHFRGLYWSAIRPNWSYAGLPRPFETEWKELDGTKGTLAVLVQCRKNSVQSFSIECIRKEKTGHCILILFLEVSV